ncbi:M48 family metallopeptidase [Hyphococcus flavus]|uniref:M48 family metallopeptidase n=1 Tax=Hyphococcus flavus TaxID=1866326 RepID=A0AAE9ZCY4_9PROT|nr:M48 family metallopeptidase [Hyphococcus flavus]WDI30167.1 M48 family metallopeptidase [Hyphococcus flavus]
MKKNTLDKTRRLMTLGLVSAGVMAPAAAHAQFRLDLGKIVDIVKTLESLSIDEEDEIQMGEGLYGSLINVSGGPYRNSAVQNAVARIAQPIFETSERPAFAWDIVVLDNNEVNAWSLPGGKVAVNKGLLRYVASEDELSAVLSHEMGHAELSHVKREMKKKAFYKGFSSAATTAVAQAVDNNNVNSALGALQGPMYQLVTSGYSQDSEDEADLHIIDVFDRTGRDVAYGVGFFNTLLELVPSKSKRTTSLFSGHPETKKRIDNILEAAPAAGTGSPSAPTQEFGDVKTVFPTRQVYMRQPVEEG